MSVEAKRLKEYGFKEENMEVRTKYFLNTGYPEPIKRYWLILETSNIPVEKLYYWVVDYLRNEYSYHEVDKLTDMFAAAENSSFFGVSQQRLSIQQDKVAQFLGIIGKMVKEIFQLVRELRIIDERLTFYADAASNSKSAESAEISLKGIWIDMVEQGSKNPASVYGLARELGFATLPDLFFSLHPKKAADVDVMVDKLDFNRKVREVLKRKLRTFIEWKKQTYYELKNKRRFTLKYLRQHFDIIKLYMSWCKPYLKHIKRLTMSQKGMDSADVISAFESSQIEIELLFKHRKKHHYSCVLCSFNYRTRPAMNYQQDGYQRGPLHMGRLEFYARGYVWTKEEVQKFKRMKEEEDMELLSVVDGSVKAAMESLGEELRNYLVEAGETFEDSRVDEPEPVKPKNPTFLSPFIDLTKGFGELFMSLAGINFSKSKSKPGEVAIHSSFASAKKHMNKAMWDVYKNFKKSHKMYAW